MTDGKLRMDTCQQHLIALREELTGWGVRCELNDRGARPRLRIYCPSERGSADFDHNVVAAPVVGRWFFFWPWAEPIGPVARLAEAAGRIIDDLGLDGDPGGDGPMRSVTSLVVWRMIKQARAEISSPLVPGARLPPDTRWRAQ